MTAPLTPERLAEIRQAGWLAWCQVVQVLNEAETALTEAERLRVQAAAEVIELRKELSDCRKGIVRWPTSR